ncbi:MAG: DUF2490 domain-containing protein [Candidatus Omnitrophica bacterium]|nr:DUF2490 domain-containing protein [Candidatus Omnitrophota bacterium]
MKILQGVVLLCVLFQATVAWCWDDADFQFWHTQQQEFKLDSNSRLTLEEEFRWGDDASDFYYHHYDVGYLYGAGKHLDVGLAFRKIFEEKKRVFKEENRPELNLIVKTEIAGWKIEDRNRFEQRFIESAKDYGRYRNKLTLKLPWKWTRFEIQPYVADEVFVDLDKTNLSRNRLYSGIQAAVTRSIKAEAYYLRQASKSAGSWSDLNVLGLRCKVSF